LSLLLPLPFTAKLAALLVFSSIPYADIYEQGSSYLQQNKNKKTTIDTFAETRKELGKFTKVKDSRINPLINKAHIEYRVVSDFEKAGQIFPVSLLKLRQRTVT
jgi:hypothetical protein